MPRCFHCREETERGEEIEVQPEIVRFYCFGCVDILFMG